jgi:hypothetical protein
MKVVDDSLLMTDASLFTAFINKTASSSSNNNNDNNNNNGGNSGGGGKASGVGGGGGRRQLLNLLGGLENLVSISDPSTQLARIDAVFTFEELLTNHRYKIYMAYIYMCVCVCIYNSGFYSVQSLVDEFAFNRTATVKQLNRKKTNSTTTASAMQDDDDGDDFFSVDSSSCKPPTWLGLPYPTAKYSQNGMVATYPYTYMMKCL